MSDKVQGTFFVDGMIQGKLPDEHQTPERLRDVCHSSPLKLNIEIDGNSFNILAVNTPQGIEGLSCGVSDAVSGEIARVLLELPPVMRPQVLSTIRSTEYTADSEVQTIYAVGPDGEVHTRQRVVEAKTTAPPPKLTGRQKLRVAGLTVAVLAVLFGVSAFFVPYSQLFSNVMDRLRPFNLDELNVQAGDMKSFFTVDKKERGDDFTLVLTLKRVKNFPTSAPAYDKLLQKSATSLPAHLAVESMGRGYIHAEFLDKDGNVIRREECRIADLQKQDTMKLTLSLRMDRRATQLRLTY